MQTLIVKSFLQHLYHLLRVYLAFALVGILLALLYGVVTGPLSNVPFQELFVTLIFVLVYLVVAAGIVGIVVIVVRRIVRNKRRV
jgi:hypothetical protein